MKRSLDRYCLTGLSLVLICLLTLDTYRTISGLMVLMRVPNAHVDVLEFTVNGLAHFWVIPKTFYVYPMPAILGLLLCSAGSARLLVQKKWVPVAISGIAYALFSALEALSLTRLPGSEVAWLLATAVVTLTAAILIGLGIGRLELTLAGIFDISTPTSNLPTSKSGQRGFTLVEVLVVIAIVGILTAILSASVLRSKQSASVTREESQIRNLYVAVGLYEADHNETSPISLAEISPVYAPGSLLGCPDDKRTPLKSSDWPANPGVLWSEQDDSVISRMRSPHMVSYFFMRSWQRSFPAGRTYQELRNDPEVGFIAGFGLFDCVSRPDGDIGTCRYANDLSKYNAGEPATNMGGTMVEARTDGSLVTRHRNGPCDSGFLFSQVFLFQDMTCH